MENKISCFYSNQNFEFDASYISFMKLKKLENCIGCNGEKDCDKKILVHNNRKELLMIDEVNLYLKYIKTKSLSSQVASP